MDRLRDMVMGGEAILRPKLGQAVCRPREESFSGSLNRDGDEVRIQCGPSGGWRLGHGRQTLALARRPTLPAFTEYLCVLYTIDDITLF